MKAGSVARLQVTLNEVKPKVQRRLEVPLSVRLDRLHLVLQAALGWTNSHLYEFRAGSGRWGIPDPDHDEGPLDARMARLSEVLEDTGSTTLSYLYDFGDGWEHTIKVERVAAAVPDISYPVLLDAMGRCPPEDVGGPWSYEAFLDIIADPDHEEHASTVRWAGGTFDPKVADVEALTAKVAALARRWNRQPSGRRAVTAPS